MSSGRAQRLIERDLVERYEVGRGTVRAALQRLEHEGLVTVETHRGAFVRQLDRQALRELFELRTALELESAHRALAANNGKLPTRCTRPSSGWRLPASAEATVVGAHRRLPTATSHESIVACRRQPAHRGRLPVS